MLGLAADPVRKTYWVYTDQSLFELVVANEDKDVWKSYLDKGNYEVALRYAKVRRFSSSQLDGTYLRRVQISVTLCWHRKQMLFSTRHAILTPRNVMHKHRLPLKRSP